MAPPWPAVVGAGVLVVIVFGAWRPDTTSWIPTSLKRADAGFLHIAAQPTSGCQLRPELPAEYEGNVLTKATKNSQNAAEACWASCKASSKCHSWCAHAMFWFGQEDPGADLGGVALGCAVAYSYILLLALLAATEMGYKAPVLIWLGIGATRRPVAPTKTAARIHTTAASCVPPRSCAA